MSLDTFLNVLWAAIVPSLMAFVGIWISFVDLKSKIHKIISISAFIFLLLVGVITAAWAQRRSEQAQQQRDNSIASLSSQLNVMAQYALHPSLAPELQEFIRSQRQPAPKRSSTTPPSNSSKASSGVAIPPESSASNGSQEPGNAQLKTEVLEFTARLRDFENAFVWKQREIDFNQPMFLNEEAADRDRRVQQETINRLQRLSDYETTYRKQYLPEALRLQGELIKRTPPTQFPDVAPLPLIFGSPTPLGGGFLFGTNPLHEVADYLERLANRLP
jgi:hypothetical protein